MAAAVVVACGGSEVYDDGSVVFEVPGNRFCMTLPSFGATPDILATERLAPGEAVSCTGKHGEVWAIRLHPEDIDADLGTWLSEGEGPAGAVSALSGGEAMRFVDTVETSEGPVVRVARVRRTAVEVQIAAVMLKDGGGVGRADRWLDRVRFVPLGEQVLGKACPPHEEDLCWLAVREAMAAGQLHDPDAATRMADDLCDHGTADDCLWAGVVHEQFGNSVRASERFELACTDGQAEACRHAGRIARTAGAGQEASASWFEAGCVGGDAQSCLALAESFDSGDAPDHRQATRWLVRACELGAGGACALAARRVATGLAATRSEPERDRLRARACELGDELSCAVSRDGCVDDFEVALDGLRDLVHPALSKGDVEREFGVTFGTSARTRSTGCWAEVAFLPPTPERAETTVAVAPAHSCFRRSAVHSALGAPQSMRSADLPKETWLSSLGGGRSESVLVEYSSFEGCVTWIRVSE